MPPYSGIRKVNGASGNNKCSAVCGRFLVQIEEIALHQARLSRQWDKILEHLLAKTRKNAGCKEVPSYAIINSQSVKAVATSEEREERRGKNKNEETVHYCRRAWEFIACCRPCREYPQYEVRNFRYKSHARTLFVYSIILCRC